jgi:hypothetical protein
MASCFKEPWLTYFPVHSDHPVPEDSEGDMVLDEKDQFHPSEVGSLVCHHEVMQTNMKVEVNIVSSIHIQRYITINQA